MDYKEQCALWTNPKTGKSKIFVPNYESESHSACTDIFDLDSMKWSKMEKDDRVALHGGYAIR